MLLFPFSLHRNVIHTIVSRTNNVSILIEVNTKMEAKSLYEIIYTRNKISSLLMHVHVIFEKV